MILCWTLLSTILIFFLTPTNMSDEYSREPTELKSSNWMPARREDEISMKQCICVSSCLNPFTMATESGQLRVRFTYWLSAHLAHNASTSNNINHHRSTTTTAAATTAPPPQATTIMAVTTTIGAYIWPIVIISEDLHRKWLSDDNPPKEV